MRNYAVLDTDFISKCMIAADSSGCKLFDEVLKLPYQFYCHRQIVIELGRHNPFAASWIEQQNDVNVIVIDDRWILKSIYDIVKNGAFPIYLQFLKSACDFLGINHYENCYQKLETISNFDEFVEKLKEADGNVGESNNLGELKSFVTIQCFVWLGYQNVFYFMSDDRRARLPLMTYINQFSTQSNGISCFGVFVHLKKYCDLSRERAMEFANSWIAFYSHTSGQSTFKIYDTKGTRIKLSGEDIINGIFDHRIGLRKDGDLKVL